jgi:hypothetical protein
MPELDALRKVKGWKDWFSSWIRYDKPTGTYYIFQPDNTCWNGGQTPEECIEVMYKAINDWHKDSK